MNPCPSSRTLPQSICILWLVATGGWLPVTSAVAESPESDAVWSSFQNGGQLNLGDRPLPQRWSPDENVAWEAELPGLGQSTPLVDGELVYVTATSGPNKEVCHLGALDLASGQQQWQLKLENPTPVENTNYVSRAAPTGVLHDRGVIALFEGGLVVLASRDGETRWQRNLVADYEPVDARHGLGSSLEHRGPHVFISIQRSEEPYLLALDKTTGETV